MPKKSAILHIACALIILLIVGWLDSVTGTAYSFFVFYYIPLAYIRWYGERSHALVFPFLAAAMWYLADPVMHSLNVSDGTVYWNTGIRLLAFLTLTFVISHLKLKFDRERTLNHKLSSALSQVKQLSGMLPICSSCKKSGTIKVTGSKLKSTFGNTQRLSLPTVFALTVRPNSIRNSLKRSNKPSVLTATVARAVGCRTSLILRLRAWRSDAIAEEPHNAVLTRPTSPTPTASKL